MKKRDIFPDFQMFGKKVTRLFEHWHLIAALLILYDLLVVVGAYFVALWLRFDCRFMEIPHEYLMAWLNFSPIYAVISIFVFWKLHLYQSVWRFASFIELERVAIASVISGVLHAVGISVLFTRMPITYYIVGAAIQFLLILFIRFAYRFILLERSKRTRALEKTMASRVMLIGAGSAGQMILRDLHGAKEVNERVCCIIDDNRNKWGRFIDGVPIVGGRDDILLNVDKYKIEKIFLAIPSATAEQRRDILDICKETNCELKNLPGVYEFVTGNITAKAMKDVAVEDLLGRDPIKVNMDEIYQFITDKVILVTGGGGSIGSELCRQIAKHNPKQLIVFDIYENNAYSIGLELREKYPELNLEVLIGSVRDSRRINQVFKKYKPDVVYHAAAHKHVPLMEDSPCEAIKNNAIGTYKTAYAAMVNGCRRFVLISTDKAVNPTNIMGASKRLCEMIIQSFDKKIRDGKAGELSPLYVHTEDTYGSMLNMTFSEDKPKTDFVAVRFGNVLGSNGSVIPLFKAQIENGGPVTVTHPDVIRYFMLIPEAVSLVLQAGAYAQGGEIFILDMGSPVKIRELAENLIRLSGYVPGEDIEIKYTGLRDGEKLYEELLISEEGIQKTQNDLIYVARPMEFDSEGLFKKLEEIRGIVETAPSIEIVDIIKELVPTFVPNNALFNHQEDEKELEETCV